MTHHSLLRSDTGQSLIEVLIAMAVSVILLGAAVQLLVTSFTIDTRSKDIQNATPLAQELLNDAVAVAESDWYAMYDLLKDGTQYYLDASSTPAVGATTTVRADKTFTKYFTVENVSRDPVTDDIEDPYDSDDDDPSTQKITATVSWSVTGGSAATKDLSLVQYVTQQCGAGNDFTITSGNNVTFVFNTTPQYTDGIGGSLYTSVLTNDSIADIPLTITAGQAVYINDPDIMINSDSIGVQESTGGPIDTSLSVTIPSGDQLALYFYVGVPGSPGAVPLIDQTGLTIPGNYFAYITASVGYCARLINIFITLN